MVIMNNSLVNTGLQTLLQAVDFGFFKYMSRSPIAESCGSSTFKFLRTIYSIFHNDPTNDIFTSAI